MFGWADEVSATATSSLPVFSTARTATARQTEKNRTAGVSFITDQVLYFSGKLGNEVVTD